VIFWLAKIINGLTGWDIVKLQKRLILAAMLLVLLIIVGLGLWARSCWNSHKTKVTAQQTVAAQQAIAKGDREEMTKVLVDIAVTEKQIDANLANSDRQKLEVISEAKREASKLSNEELAKRLEELASE
jgi:biopolymer transport protein ExbB/TolQ